MMNKETASNFNNDVCDGFIQPTLAWCATNADHINQIGGSGMSTNFWVGKPEDVKKFAEKMVVFYKDFVSNDDNFSEPLEDYESISVAYWEKNGLAMCADLCTSDDIFDMLPEELLSEANNITQVLFNGNDNHPGAILKNDDCNLSVDERINLATFMKYDSTVELFDDPEEFLPDFSDEEVERLKLALIKN